MRRFNKLFVSAIIWLCVVSPSLAEDSDETDELKRPEFDAPALTSTWTVRFGGSFDAYDTLLAWSPKGLGGTVIPVEDTLGLDESDETFMLGAVYQFNRRHSIELSLNEVRRSADRILDEEIEWGDYIYRAEGEIESELNIAVLGLKYKYDFSDSGRLNAGFSVGLSTFRIEASIAGEARIDDGSGEEWVEGIVEGTDVLAPVPQIGVFLDYALTRTWLVRFSAEVIDLDISGHSGRVVHTVMGIEYGFTDSFSVGLNIGTMDLEYRTERGDDMFGVDYKVKSVGGYLSWAF